MNLKALLALMLVASSATPQRLGTVSAASSTIPDDPATFDLGGFRLGMTEAEVEAAIRSRGISVRGRTRVVDFETRVRTALGGRDNGSFHATGRSVLQDASLDDGHGGTVSLQLLGWPDGAHVSFIMYVVPRGTASMAWRDMLVAKYGSPGEVSRTARFHATWCGRKDCYNTADRFRLQADVGEDGGSIALTQPEGMAGHVTEAVDAEVSRRSKGGGPAL